MSDSDSDGDNVSNDLVGFMFGNIDRHGHLENDVLDDKSKSHLMQLTTLAGLGDFVSELTKEEQPHGGVLEPDEKIVSAPDAVDYSNINELADDNDIQLSRGGEYGSSEVKKPSTSHPKPSPTHNEGGGIILPSIVSHSSRHSGSSPDRKVSSDSEHKSKHKHEKKSGLSKHERKRRRRERLLQEKEQSEEQATFNLRLAAMQEKIGRSDIRKVFPEFRPSQVLRFLRLFGGKNSSSMPNIWRNCKRRRKKRSKEEVGGSGRKEETGRELGEWSRPWSAPALPDPDPEECLTDEEQTMLRPMKSRQRGEQEKVSTRDHSSVRIPPWRYGPAALWYDMLGVPESGAGFDYGFKLKEPGSDAFNGTTSVVDTPSFPSPAHFYMVSQVRWEDDIIWNAEDVKHKVGKSILTAPDPDERFKHRVDRAAQAGWVPTSTQRTALPHGGAPNTRGPLTLQLEQPSAVAKDNSKDDKTVGSIFPIDNYELIYGDWEKEIIWDDQNMDHIPQPTVFKFDPNDQNIILNVPDEPKICASPQSKDLSKKELKKGKTVAGKASSSKEKEEEGSLSKSDRWNLSNDGFYDPRKSAVDSLAIGLMSSVLQHSTPAMELHPMLFSTNMNQDKLQHFHRPQFRLYQHGGLAKPGLHKVHCVMKHLRKKAKQREQERAASGGGEVFFMRKLEDLTALDGHLVLCEHSEEFPPLLSQVGMALKVKNYHKRKPDKDLDPTRYRYGETVFCHSSPFLGSLAPGQSLQAFECNMYRAPIYEHRSNSTDFLLIRTRHNYFIRHVPFVFAVGQQCPLVEIPGPNSKKATNHVRDFLQVYIYRMFAKNQDHPKKIRMEEIRKAFPNHSESSIRKRLKLCSDFNRTGQDSNWWVIKQGFRLPTEEEMGAIVSPEQSCAFYSMIAAEQRLKDAGYGEKTMLCTPEDDTEEEHQMKVDEEVLNAPWNTTRAFIAAMKGKCLLQVTGQADPTGCGEGFSYVKVPMKPQQPRAESAPAPPKKLVTGTDADLRRLSLSNAKQLLKKFGVPDEEIKKLSRWEVIDVVRTMSTEQARSGSGGASKFARGTRFSVAEHQEKYKEECQRLFDLQNKVLSSREVLSTDEDSSSADDSDFEEMGKNIENILSNRKSSTQMSMEKEEQERKELMKMMHSEERNGVGGKGRKGEESSPAVANLGSLAGSCMKIHRKFREEDGTEFVRTEIVRKTEVIEAYVRIRSSKNEDFIKKFMMLDEQLKEEMRREKRRIQDQLRRIKRNQEKEESERRRGEGRADSSKAGSQMKCGACGGVGHMRTNRYCPAYNKSAPPVALTQEEEENMERRMFNDSQNLVKVDGTKITLSKDIFKQAELVRRKSLVLKFQKPEPTPSLYSPPVPRKKRRHQGSVTHCDYLTRITKKKERRRADPVVTLSSLLEGVLTGMREIPEVEPFKHPVNPRSVKDYYKVVEKPMDLQTMRENTRKHAYLSRADFREHVELIISNSRLYNGTESPLTRVSQSMLQYMEEQFKVLEDKLMRLEKAINPLLDDDDQVAFSFILDNIITQNMMAVPESWPFHNPVNKKFVQDYYTVIEKPMDLGTVRKNVQKHMYQNRGQFMEHVELILTNSIKFNGPNSAYTETARQIVKVCQKTLEDSDAHLTQLENDIAAAKKAAEAEAADIDDTSDSIRDFDEDSNMSFNISDDKMAGIESDVDVEVMSENTTTMDEQLNRALREATTTASAPNNEDLENKSRLLEDLLMSDGEMSGESEVEGDNPFATRSDSEGSDQGREDSMLAPQLTVAEPEPVVSNPVTSYLDAALSEANNDAIVTSNPALDLALSSDGDDSHRAGGSDGSFVSVGGEVVSDSELSDN